MTKNIKILYKITKYDNTFTKRNLSTSLFDESYRFLLKVIKNVPLGAEMRLFDG